MKWEIKKPVGLLKTIRESFYLKKHTPSDSTMKILKDLYPNVNWNRVDFYEGLPWFTPTVAPYVTAQALPRFYSFGGFRIYLRKFDESRAQCIADIVHEAFHVMQAMHFGKGYGIGFFRGWMWYYIGLFIKFGYRQNPFEIPAYNQEFRFLQYCNQHGQHGVVPPVQPEALKNIGSQPDLVFPRYSFRYEGKILHLFFSLLFCTVVTVIKPVADVMAFFIAGVYRRQQASYNSEKTSAASG